VVVDKVLITILAVAVLAVLVVAVAEPLTMAVRNYQELATQHTPALVAE
jgi:hypothetical protein